MAVATEVFRPLRLVTHACQPRSATALKELNDQDQHRCSPRSAWARCAATGSRLRGHPPAGCQDGEEDVPWDPADDLATSTQYVSVVVLGLVTITVLILGIYGRQSRSGRWLRTGGLALTVASTTLPIVLWWSSRCHGPGSADRCDSLTAPSRLGLFSP